MYISVFVGTWDDVPCASDGRARFSICHFKIENTAIEESPRGVSSWGVDEYV